jgi:hypothetical protein
MASKVQEPGEPRVAIGNAGGGSTYPPGQGFELLLGAAQTLLDIKLARRPIKPAGPKIESRATWDAGTDDFGPYDQSGIYLTESYKNPPTWSPHQGISLDTEVEMLQVWDGGKRISDPNNPNSRLPRWTHQHYFAFNQREGRNILRLGNIHRDQASLIEQSLIDGSGILVLDSFIATNGIASVGQMNRVLETYYERCIRPLIHTLERESRATLGRAEAAVAAANRHGITIHRKS